MSGHTLQEIPNEDEILVDELLTVTAVAGMFNVGRPTVYRLLGNGSLGAVRIGGSIRIPRGEVRAFLARNTEAAQVGGTTGPSDHPDAA